MIGMVGSTILHYKIIEKLGEGGMGIVYKAEDTKLERTVALKLLPRHISSNKEEQDRFKVEAKAAAALNHTNITQIYAIEQFEEESFIVMEYIDGQELKQNISVESPTIDESIKIAEQIAKGLEAAHNKDIIHRDIKSSNIMITSDGQVKIMDFGLAKVRGGSQITQIGTTLGTVAYMSPEQALGKEADERSDIWSYGIVLYEILTNRLPFEGAYDQTIIYSILNDEPQPVFDPDGKIPDHLKHFIYKCLEKKPDDRYQSFTELLDILKGAAPGKKSIPVSTQPAASYVDKITRIKFRQAAFILSAVLILFLLGLLLFPSSLDTLKSLLSIASLPDEQHLLVLPITNIGGDADGQAFCDGLVETLTSKLTQLEQYHGSLWVVPSSEVRRNKISSPSEAHQIFKVNLAVSGSMQLMGDIFRLTLNLIDAKNLRQLNSSVIDFHSKEIASLQDNSVLNLMEMLKLELKPETSDVLYAGGTTVPGAYEFYLQGRGYLQRYENEDNIDLAIKLFKNAIDQDSLFVLARSGLAEAYWRKYENLKNPTLADMSHQEGEKAFKLNSKLAPVNITLGMINSGSGLYEKAIENFNRALIIDPTNPDAYRGLAKAFELQGMIDKSEETYKKAIKLKPGYWAGYNDLGTFYYRHSRYEEALDQFKQVIELTPDNYRGYNNSGGVYYSLERWTEARKMFERSLSLRKSYGVASNLGTLYFIEGDYVNAANMYEIALGINDHNYIVWGNLASACYWAPDKRKDAIQHYKTAIEKATERIKVNPNDAGTIARIAGYHAMIGNHDKAIRLIEQSLQMAPNNLSIMFEAGTLYEQLGNREKALHWLAKSIEEGYSIFEIEHQPGLHKLLDDDRFLEIVNEQSEKKSKL